MNHFSYFRNELAAVVLVEASNPTKNVHMTHLEDQVIYGGVEGAKQALNALHSLRDMLAGDAKTSVDLTVKWDGAPAIFAGIDPTDKQFFVAKKGIFNKNPVVYKTADEIDADTSGDLAKKLKVALAELSKLGITGIVQGDIMFTHDDLKNETIEGTQYITFQPNTLVYAIPTKSNLAKSIGGAKIGVVFHTSYSGDSFESLVASYNVDIAKFNKVPSVWYQDAGLHDISGKALMTATETKAVTASLSIADKIFKKIEHTVLEDISNHPTMAQTLETFNNTLIRRGEHVIDTAAHVDNLIKWIAAKYAKEAEGRSTEKGKLAVAGRRDEFLQFFSEANKANLKLIYDLQNAIVSAKNLIIRKLDSIKDLNTFVRTSNGFRVTGQEGFVAIDKIGGGAVKLVDRLEFSMNNFSPDIIKGWDKK